MDGMHYIRREFAGNRDSKAEDRRALRVALLMSVGSIVGTIVIGLVVARSGLMPVPDERSLPWTIEQGIALL